MEEIVKIATLENEIEAKLLDIVLVERNIPHFIGTYHDAAYDGIFQPQKGWGFVETPASYKSQVLEILSDIRKGDGIEK
ncbi:MULTISPECIES: hypothetical protein [Tepidanaerobacter]|uniref:DUF2007 domain-containing protein n=1 Tax=Tepidanaerobacter syntrophicus TaxID=224999 RepID=A0A0U9I498_9FIRM|nr:MULTISPECIES: hypothetical protein [Tepidanaerobacter]GAQ25080.1 hypothetical protein TSYNT_798 [Tepidanaerobacter syntrophicus]GLI18589.1 hypothetical protein TSYNTROPHJE_04020 [Tepidanaerobacter syntrophicus]GLI50648.1 hypothetical protein TSYNTROOL_07340 [Tepidanaerobacter syntrophicus]HHV82861.1 hypothetical protein [Tepidanaerobacter syntrophicus]